MAVQKQPWKPAGERLAESLEDGTYALTRAAVEGAMVTIYTRNPDGSMREIDLANLKWKGGELQVRDRHASFFAMKPCTYVAYYAPDGNPTPQFRAAIEGKLTVEEITRVIGAYKMLLELKGGP